MEPGAPQVALVMGSRSDWPTLKGATEALDALGVAWSAQVVSAHRTPERLYAFAKGAKEAGIKVIIAGAGGAAHLPGMAASMTELPVLGVPVGTLAIGKAGAINAALLAASVLALNDPALAARLAAWRKQRSDAVAERPEGQA